MNDKVNPVVGRINFSEAKPWHPPTLVPAKQPRFPSPESVLDAIVEDYVRTMEAQGVAIGAPERAAIRRMANINYAFYCAISRVLES
jgi:hypothetical protein